MAALLVIRVGEAYARLKDGGCTLVALETASVYPEAAPAKAREALALVAASHPEAVLRRLVITEEAYEPRS